MKDKIDIQLSLVEAVLKLFQVYIEMARRHPTNIPVCVCGATLGVQEHGDSCPYLLAERYFKRVYGERVDIGGYENRHEYRTLLFKEILADFEELDKK